MIPTAQNMQMKQKPLTTPYTPALLTSAPSPLTAISNFSTTLLAFLSGLSSGLGISIVFDLFGRNGIGVEGLEDKNYAIVSNILPHSMENVNIPN
jgi:hypothetical protein